MEVDINIRITGGPGKGAHRRRADLPDGRRGGAPFPRDPGLYEPHPGGRNSYSIRVMDVPVRAGRAAADILLALDPDHLPHFLPDVELSGLVLADPSRADLRPARRPPR